ncbi:MAG TPA: hypothetical protein VGR00_08280 [Thermoanaerobaculia bacterium]|nr:hypothetical protein [Thermoanaerobaculia bacterium]
MSRLAAFGTRALPLLAATAFAAPPAPRPLPAPFLSGVSFAMTNDSARGYDSAAARRTLDALSRGGVTAVSVMPFAFQRTPGDSSLRWRLTHPASESDEQMTAAIREAKRRGLAVLVKPQVWLRGSWPGEIDPSGPGGFASWWRDYRAFILHHAALAAREKADGFCVGTELTRLQGRPEWRALVEEVRGTFAGFVVYAANWDALDVPFSDLLDAVGVDLYAPLSADAKANDAVLYEGARGLVARLDALGAKVMRPVLLTETGFPARPACWTRPHDERGTEADAEAQRRATHALLSALETSKAVRGLFWWKVFSDGECAGEGDGSYRLTGRPAEKELFEFFRRLSHNAQRTTQNYPGYPPADDAARRRRGRRA